MSQQRAKLFPSNWHFTLLLSLNWNLPPAQVSTDIQVQGTTQYKFIINKSMN